MKGRILIVEDSPTARLTLEFMLEEATDAPVDSADSVGAALAMAQERPPMLVLLDLNLPDGTGFDVAETLRHGDAPPSFALVTSDPPVQAILQARAMGFVAVLSKPPDPDMLTALVHDHLGP